MAVQASVRLTQVLLADGSGVGLGATSRKVSVGQFQPLSRGDLPFQASVRRLTSLHDATPLIMTNDDLRFVLSQQLSRTSLPGADIVIVPAARGTASTILAAALLVAAKDLDGLVLVTPADRMIPDSVVFAETLLRAAKLAGMEKIVTFSDPLTPLSTAGGYPEISGTGDETLAMEKLFDKADAGLAADMAVSGNSQWNTGTLMFQASAMIAAFEVHAPEYLSKIGEAIDSTRCETGIRRLNPVLWNALPNKSIDAILGQLNNVETLSITCGCVDRDGWDSTRERRSVASSNRATGHGSTAIECQTALLRPGSVVSQLGACSRCHHPWGWDEILAREKRFQVKRIKVEPGASLSLQMHMHRSEHWVVVFGTALVTIDGEQSLITENQSIYVPLGVVHGIENPGRVPLILIGVQTGPYLEEDDTIPAHDLSFHPVRERTGSNGNWPELPSAGAQADVNSAARHVS